MPTPAESIHQFRWNTLTESGSLGTFSSGEWSEIRTKVRPASTTNPVRPDKTRAPGDWDVWANAGWYENDGGMEYYYLADPNQVQTLRGAVLSQSSFGDLRPDMAEGESLLRNVRLQALSAGTESWKQLSAAAKQANQTLKMVGAAASDFAHGLDNLMRGPGGLAQRAGKMANWRKIPSRYLEYLYGWAPLGDDLANAFDQLNNMRIEGFGYSMILSKRRTISGGCRRFAKARFPALGYTPLEEGSWILDGKRTSRAICTYRFDLPSWYIDQTPTLAPFSTAWELLPYSFVLDWFIPVGNWLGALESAQWSPFFKEGSETLAVRERYGQPSGLSPWPASTPWTWRTRSVIPPTGFWDTFVMRRRKVESFPYAFTTPPALNPFPGLQQASQGLSLLTQAFQRWR